MLKATWVAEKPFSYQAPRLSTNHVRSSKAVAGSLIMHVLLLSLGYSVAFQASEPKREIESSTFRWNISLTTAPLQEPVTSDTPSPFLSAPSQETVAAHSETSDHATFMASSEHSRSTLKENPGNLSTEISVQSKTIASPSTDFPVKPSLNIQKQAITPSKATSQNSQPSTQEQIKTVPFTHGQTANLPPPVKRVVDRAEQVMQPSTQEEPRIIQRARVFHPPIRRRETRPDYGWLITDLRMTLERLKFYPEVARINKWQGKVVVQLKILEGGHLIDMEIQESSGFEVLDQTALTIVRQASPLDLGHRLPSNHVSLSVPLTFQLE
ncbi:TonB family protein [uncultured Nitrospira sp.]|uniref:energy transducer TonB n=1 Tax=uncultured Nitrospira sp. TaxID=157176 RepID=UPI00314025FF